MKKQITGMILLACIVAGIVVIRMKHLEIEKNETQLIVSGSMYEITENDCIKGLDHEFTSEEMKIWNEVYQNNSVQEEQGYLLNGTQKYMINLYDADENEVLEYMLDGNGQLFDGKQDGQAVSCVEIENMLEQIIAENK